jgi:hypothetical protein
MTKQIKVRIIYERTCPALPENYDGETDVEKMKEMEREQMEDGMILMDMVINTEPKVEVTVEE